MAGNLTFNVDANDQASGTFAAVAAELKALARELDRIDGRNVRARVTINTPSSGVIAQLDRARAAIAEIDGRNARARVEITGTPGAAEVRALRAAAKALRDLDGQNAVARISVTGDLPNARELRSAARALRDLEQVGAINIHISITGAVSALAQVAALRRELRGLPNDTTVKVKAEADSSAITTAAKALLTLRGAAVLLGPTLLGSTVPAIATLTGSLVSLAGLAPLAVAGLAALGAVGATVAVGFAHINDALGPTGTPAQIKKVNEAMAALSPNARAAVQAIRGFSDAWSAVRLDVQDKLFAGLNTQIKEMGGAYLPILRSGLGGVATELNGVAKNVVAFARSSQTMQDVNAIFDNTRVALRNAAPAANNLLGAFRDIAVVGSGFLPGLATGLTNVTQRFQTFISEARQSGQLKVWIQDGVDTLRTLGSIAGNVGSVLGSVFTAAKASGADFLTTLDKVTGKLADLLSSSTGQSALTAFFKESRQAIDALLPGVEALATGVLKMIQSFSTSGGLQTFATTVSGIAQSLAPLLPMLGNLAGGVLRDLSNGAAVAAGALGPLVGIVTGVVGALGPLPALALAAVVAFKALGSAAIAGSFATLASRLTALAPAIGTYAAGLTGSLAAGRAAQTATTGLGTALGKLGNALPLIGVALIAVGFAYDAARDKSEDFAKSVIAGTDTMASGLKKTQAQFEGFSGWWTGVLDNLFNGDLVNNNFNGTMDEAARASDNFRAKVESLIQAMPALEGAQTRVKVSTQNLADAILTYGESSPQAAAAAQVLARDTADLKQKQDLLTGALRNTTEGLKAQADQMNSQINTALAYSQAVQRTAEAQKAANDALKNSGAKSEEYKGAVLSLASAMSSQADAARKQAEALGGTEAGVQAYNTEILRAADLSTQAGRDAFAQLASGLDDAGLKAISTAAEMSNLRTEIITLPDGRKVTVVVEADRAKLDSVKQGVEDLASKKYIGSITILAETTTARGDILQTVQLADGSRGTVKIDADGGPAILTVGATKYTIDQTTGTLKVLGDVAPGETSLNGLKLLVDSTTGQMKLSAEPTQANTTVAAWKALADGITGIPQLNANPAAANGVLQLWKSTSDATTGLPTIDANSGKAEGVLAAWKALANGTTGIPALDSNPGLANQILAAWKARSDATTGLPKVIPQVQAGAAEAQLANLARTRYTTIIATVVAGQSTAVPTATGVKRIAGGAAGGIVHPYARGAVVEQYAAGGVRPLTPMRGDIAQRVPANTWRVIGDRPRGLEYFLPDDSAPRSMKIGAEWARNRGLDLVPSGGGVAQRISSALGPARTGSASTAQGAAWAGISAVASGVAQLRGDIQTLATEIRKQRPFTVEDRSGNPVETARATALALRIS
ncbi:hypothetical protein [Pseudonocardia sp. 73-21]|uniref:hypothetical protein n=1 Tax=Pseudonocardia sp. 73-21 TaxID=1895809 RepID=UPI0009627DB5|nr:hypothetical protein [Pseudonocardia sp. 73-21]OJY47592.1 MAG: hypothetical protein BGP03_33205 [Pseudonocardia sp. 73-21]